MFEYSSLSPNRRLFIDAALKEYPNLIHDKYISRNQIQEVVDKHKLNFPQWFCNAPGNRMGRGTFHFPVPKDAEVIETVIEKTDEEIEHEIIDKFKTIDTCIRSVATGITKSLLLSGPPGCGKSQETRNILTEMCEDSDTNFTFVSGKSSATGLYKLLYDNRFENCVTVLDDTDSVFFNEDSLNILKKVCDLSSNERKVSWLTETKLISEEDGELVPRSYVYEGGLIFITNYNFDELIAKGSKLSPHLEAFVSRGLYISAGLDTIRERMVQIKLKLREGMLHNKGFTKKDEDDIYSFMEENCNNLREVSLRMCVKMSSIMRIDHINWKNIVRETCFKR